LLNYLKTQIFIFIIDNAFKLENLETDQMNQMLSVIHAPAAEWFFPANADTLLLASLYY